MKYKLPLPFIVLSFCLSTALLVCLMNFISPNDYGVAGIFVVLIGIFLFFFSLFVLLARLLWVLKKVFSEKRPKGVMNFTRFKRRSLLISAVLAFAPLLLVSLSSLGQMQLWYLVLVLIFEVMAIFFIIKKL